MCNRGYTHPIASSSTLRSYRLIRTLFGKTTHWKLHDPFLEQKVNTFQSSASAIHRAPFHSASSFVHLTFPGLGLAETIDLDGQKDRLQNDEAALRMLLGEMMHMPLGQCDSNPRSALSPIIVD